MTDDEYAEARLELGRAIVAYHQKIEPDVYVDAWVVVTHKRSPELEQTEQSMVGMTISPEQSWVTTRGLLDIAVTRERADQFQANWELDDDD